jgi:hypothetical protein
LKRQNRGNRNVEIHHIPPRAALAANELPEYGTPAIAMTVADHAKTGSYGGGGKGYVDEQIINLVTNDTFFEAMSKDIADVQSISRDYDSDLIDAIDYAEKKGKLTGEEADKLRLQCSG